MAGQDENIPTISEKLVDWRKGPEVTGEEFLKSQHKTLVALSSQPESIAWSDGYFVTNYLNVLKRKKEPTMDTAITQAKVFVKFYYTGDCDVEDLVESVLCLFYFMNIGGIKLVNGDKLIGLDDWNVPINVDKWTHKPITPLFYDQAPTVANADAVHEVKKPGNLKITFTADKYERWSQSIWDSLVGGNIEEVKKTINYLGFLAGICVRLIIKDTKSVSEHIFSMADDRYTSIFGQPPPFGSTPAPVVKACEFWATNIRKLTPYANRILTTCVAAKIYSPITSRPTTDGAWKAMCLLSLGAVGLGAISWSIKASEAMSMTLAEFLANMCLGNYRKTARSLFKFIETVGRERQQTYMFGRLFQDGAFIELSTRNNPEFVMACAALATGENMENEIWGIQQFSKFAQHVPAAVIFAMCFRSYHTQSKIADVGLADPIARGLAQNYMTIKEQMERKMEGARRQRNEESTQDHEGRGGWGPLEEEKDTEEEPKQEDQDDDDSDEEYAHNQRNFKPNPF